MKLEAIVLGSLCVVGMLVCTLVLGAMLTATPMSPGDKTAATATPATVAACPQVAIAAVSPPAHD